MSISIPQEQRLRYLRNIEQWKGKRGNLESIMGKLIYVCQTLIQGKNFLRRIIDKLGSVKSKSHYVNLNREEKRGLGMMETHFSILNGQESGEMSGEM